MGKCDNVVRSGGNSSPYVIEHLNAEMPVLGCVYSIKSAVQTVSQGTTQMFEVVSGYDNDQARGSADSLLLHHNSTWLGPTKLYLIVSNVEAEDQTICHACILACDAINDWDTKLIGSVSRLDRS